MRAREHDLRALGRVPDLEDVGAHAVAGVVALARESARARAGRLGLADLQDDVALLDAVDHARARICPPCPVNSE